MRRQKTIYPLLLILVAALVSGCQSSMLMHVAKVDVTTPQGRLIQAAEQGDAATVEKLLAEGADPGGEGQTVDALGWADFRGHLKVGKMIADRCMQIYVPGRNCMSLPNWVVGNGDAAMLTALLAKGLDLEKVIPLLGTAASKDNMGTAKFLVARGADIDQAVKAFETHNASMSAMDDYNSILRKAIAKNNAAIAFLGRLRQATSAEGRIEVTAADPQEEASFVKAAQDYRNAVNKPALPEEARKFKVQAEETVRDKKYEKAAELYGKALNIAPWWPEGRFNRAMILGETRYYLGAIREMKRYLTLVPNAPDARAAQDKIYAWELKAGK